MLFFVFLNGVTGLLAATTGLDKNHKNFLVFHFLDNKEVNSRY